MGTIRVLTSQQCPLILSFSVSTTRIVLFEDHDTIVNAIHARKPSDVENRRPIF
jgi:hypothetical protein